MRWFGKNKAPDKPDTIGGGAPAAATTATPATAADPATTTAPAATTAETAAGATPATTTATTTAAANPADASADSSAPGDTAAAAADPGAAPARSVPMRWRARSVCQCRRAPPMPRLRKSGSTTPTIEA